MGKVKLMVLSVMALCLSLALTGMAQAAAINCGDCHSAPPVNADNCTNTARGLHGVHYNYSSATFKKTVANYGKCAYCHPTPPDTQPTVTHNNNYINITGYSSGNIVSTGLTFTTGTPSTCTNACHRNRAQTAPWGNYTATTTGGIKLTCDACHDDSNDNASTTLSGMHKNHLLSNCTTPGAYGLISASADAGCQNCHPDNRNDLWKNGKADDGTVKAYPHATDGTHVVSDNVLLQNNIVSATKAGANTTCTTTCHTNDATLIWGATQTTAMCDLCHYYANPPTSAGNNAAVVKLSGAHSSHFGQYSNGTLITCTNCHADHTTDANFGGHARKLPPNPAYAVVNAGLGWNSTNHTCSSTGTYCHGVGNTTPDFTTPGSTPACAVCHEYPGVAGRDWTGYNGHTVRYDSPVVNTHLVGTANYNGSTDNYSTVVTNVNLCGKCHHPAAGVSETADHRNGTIDVNPQGNGNCSGNFTVNVITSGSNVTCGNVKCHSGKTTPNWW